MFGSIRWRIALVFAVLILACIGGLSAYLSHFLRGNYIDNLETELANEARLIADSASPYFGSGQTEELEALSLRLADKTASRVTIVDVNGVVLGDSEEDPAQMGNHADRPEIVEALAQGEGTSIRYSATLGYDMMYVAVPVTADGNVLGTARVSLSLRRVNDAVAHVNRSIMIAGLAAAAIAVALAFLISHRTMAPVKRLTAASRRMAGGDFDQAIPVTSRDEVGDLAHAFNQMADRIRQTLTLVTTERDRIAAIVSTMADGIVVLDGEGKVTMMNQATRSILQIAEDSPEGKTFIEVVRDYEMNDVVRRCLDSGEQQSTIVELAAQRRTLGVIATPLQGEAGCLVLVHDLTEMRRLESVRRDLVSNVSHELRTPIASIKALAETLCDGAVDDPTVAKDFLEKIGVEIDKLAQMVQELGDLSRIESGAFAFSKKEMDVGRAVSRAVDRLKAQADRAGLALNAEVAAALPLVEADEERIEQVLVNLIHNALKFTQPGGIIRVTARAEGDSVLVSVADTGVGIPAEDLPRIFERFYKADKARSGGGTGLGLAIAKHIISAHEGSIWAESVEGQGSTFSFTLPVARRD